MTEEESAAWLGLAAVTQILPAALDAQLQRDSGMTHFEFLALTALAFAPDRTMRMTALAHATTSTLPRLSHVCSRLEQRGLVERSTCPEDRRATNVHLTPQGKREVARATPGHRDTVRSLVIDALTPEQLAALADITATIQSRLSGTPDCHQPGETP